MNWATLTHVSPLHAPGNPLPTRALLVCADALLALSNLPLP